MTAAVEDMENVVLQQRQKDAERRALAFAMKHKEK